MTKRTFLFGIIVPIILSVSVVCYAQSDLSIIGIVHDSKTMDPIIGASVLIKGSSNGTITDTDGKFKINANLRDTLIVSYVGYKKKTIRVNDNTLLTILIDEEFHIIDEVVVVGYGVQRKSDITGAISSVSGDLINKTPVSSALQALQGKAAGVQIIQNSGAPGTASTIKIRGTGTINDSDPLYVVDGFIVDDINHINPSDIANVEVLKDAASCSVYGSRSANGVVLITTKRGKSGKTQISFDSYVGFSTPWKKIRVMDTQNYALMLDYMNGTTDYSADGKLYYSKDPTTSQLYYDTKKFNRVDSIVKNSPKNWFDAITQTGIKQQYNVSVSGGTDKNKFLISSNYYTEKGIVKTSDYSRFTTRINSNNAITSWLTASTNISYTNESRHIVPEGSSSILKAALYQNPMAFTYNTKGFYSENHPIAILDGNHNTMGRNRVDFNTSLTAQITKWFNYQFKVSDYIITENRSNFNEVFKLDEDFQMPNDLTSVYKYQDLTNKWEINNLFNFTYDNRINNINILLGNTIEGYRYDYNSQISYGTADNDPALWYPSSTFAGNTTSGLASQWSALGFVGRINYSLLDRYLFQVNIRADGSSIFAPSKRWGYFPSLSVGWKFSSEPFMKSTDWLSMGKFRLGWGKLGNNRIDELSRYTLVTSQLSNGSQVHFNYPYGIGNSILYPGMTATSIGNPDISWEKTSTYNLGLDLSFFKYRLNATIEIFNKLTTDMLLRVPVPNSTGLDTPPMTNAGSVSNRGAELNLNFKGKLNKLSYEIGFNVSYIKNRVESLGTGNEPVYGSWLSESSIQDYVTKTEVGRPIGCFYGYVTDGIFNTYDEVKASAQYELGKNEWEQTTKPGDFRFKDLNGDGKITADDRTYLGSPFPNFTFGLPMSLGLEGFELNLFFYGQTGNKIFNVMDYYLYNGADGNVSADIREKHWSGQLTENRAYFPLNLNAQIPDLDPTDLPRNFRASDFFVKDGSYVRLQELKLLYNVSTTICEKLNVSTLSIFISATNLLTFTAYDGFDPEVGKTTGTEGNNLSLGVDQGNYPQSRTVNFGFKMGL